jgi:hypothetical protein
MSVLGIHLQKLPGMKWTPTEMDRLEKGMIPCEFACLYVCVCVLERAVFNIEMNKAKEGFRHLQYVQNCSPHKLHVLLLLLLLDGGGGG